MKIIVIFLFLLMFKNEANCTFSGTIIDAFNLLRLVTSEDIDGIESESPLFNSVSETCQEHGKEFIYQIVNNSDHTELWALQMLDAWGKISSGILTGNLASMGDFDECTGIKWNDINQAALKGKYCYSYLIPYIDVQTPLTKISDLPDGIVSRKAVSPIGLVEMMIQLLRTDYPLSPSLGTCLPSSCSTEDVNHILLNLLELGGLNESFHVVTVNCATEDSQIWRTGDYAMIAVLATLGLFLIVGTILDVVVQKKGLGGTGTVAKTFKAFSVYTNTRKWWNTDSKVTELNCLYGIKFLSTSWIVMGHTFFVHINQPTSNTVSLYNVHEDSALLMIILNAQVAVDTFLTIGALLVSYNLLKMLDKTKGKLNIPLLYLNRYIRLTPSYALILGIGATLFVHASSGPIWFIMDISAGFCRTNWWKNLLYINSVATYNPANDPTDLPCHGESWYLSTDMILFLISPFLIYPLWKKMHLGIIVLSLATITSVAIPFIITYQNEFLPAPIAFRDTQEGRYAREAYMPPWMRGAPYMVGIWTGFFLYRKPFKIPRLIVVSVWIIATASALAVLFGIKSYYNLETEIPRVDGAFYASFHRLAWSCAIAWLVFACARGYGGYVNKFLCWKGFVPLGRLGYCVYLVSYHMQLLFHLRYRQPIHYDFYSAINLFFAHMVTSYIVGFVCSITMEAPFLQLEKIIFANKTAKKVAEPEGSNSKQESKL